MVRSPDHSSPKPHSCRNLRRRGPVKGLPSRDREATLDRFSEVRTFAQRVWGEALAPSSDLIAVPVPTVALTWVGLRGLNPHPSMRTSSTSVDSGYLRWSMVIWDLSWRIWLTTSLYSHAVLAVDSLSRGKQ